MNGGEEGVGQSRKRRPNAGTMVDQNPLGLGVDSSAPGVRGDGGGAAEASLERRNAGGATRPKKGRSGFFGGAYQERERVMWGR